jgi:DNA helicase HerA-like ATPase
MAEEIKKTGFATIDYLEERAGMGRFHSSDMVNQAIETRLRMVRRTGLFASSPETETLVDRFWRITEEGKFLVFDLAELPPRRLRALTRGLNRRLESICNEERKNGGGRFPLVFLEEAHFYTSPEEILNLITRGRHLGLTTFFITNTPAQLPEVVFRQIDNMICTGLGHSGDLRTVAKSALSDEETLQSLAVGLRMTEALIVGQSTAGFPLVVEIGALPEGFPATGFTRSYWDRPQDDEGGSAETKEAA